MAKPSDAGRSRKQKNARVSRRGGPEASGPRGRSKSSPSRVSRSAKKARKSGPAPFQRGGDGRSRRAGWADPAGTRLLKPQGRAKDDARALAEAVFAEQDPVEVACGLLNGDGAKGDSVKARVWEKLLEYRFGRPAAMPAASAEGGAPRIILDLPRPERERDDSEEREESAERDAQEDE